ncbi:hypothetical protein [Phenylobacterium montanum]|uniref:Uncharacterized protein n=1 Tax=Phenylobacterium montanum TaxID=2823693 RepID=A0A975FWU7_9CAUL|nr:hypothetical protein [Caulobacter sp. S6]QUD86616.1 hypothetical protein KCG34_16190 [Caulobacter sp. S6]
MSLVSYLSNVYTQFGLGLLTLTCAYAWWKGGRAEKLGMMVVAGCWIGSDLLRAISGELIPTVILFGADAAFSIGLLIIAIRYASVWVGMAMLLESMLFALHGIQLDDADAPRWRGMVVYLLLNNMISYSVLLIFAGGTTANILKLRALRKPRPAEPTAGGLRAEPPPLASSL